MDISNVFRSYAPEHVSLAHDSTTAPYASLSPAIGEGNKAHRTITIAFARGNALEGSIANGTLKLGVTGDEEAAELGVLLQQLGTMLTDRVTHDRENPRGRRRR